MGMQGSVVAVVFWNSSAVDSICLQLRLYTQFQLNTQFYDCNNLLKKFLIQNIDTFVLEYLIMATGFIICRLDQIFLLFKAYRFNNSFRDKIAQNFQ